MMMARGTKNGHAGLQALAGAAGDNRDWHVELCIGPHRFAAYPVFPGPQDTVPGVPGERAVLAQMRALERNVGPGQERNTPQAIKAYRGRWLRAERQKHCLSRPQMARLLARHVTEQCPGHDTLISYVKRWEIGQSGVSERYRLAYCIIFGIDEEQWFSPGQDPPAPHVPNTVLRRVREQERHETLPEFAEAIERQAKRLGERVVPPERYLARLEDGTIAWPYPPCRRLLAAVCGRPLHELGFTVPGAKGAGCPEEGDG